MRRVDRCQVQLLEVEAVRDHQLHRRRSARVDHLLALRFGHGHRLFAEHVDAGVRRPHGVFGVHRVRQRNVDGVHLRQAVLDLLVGERLHAVSLGELTTLHRIAADQRGQFGVSTRVSERRKHRYLSDMAQTDHRVPHFCSSSRCHALLTPAGGNATAMPAISTDDARWLHPARALL